MTSFFRYRPCLSLMSMNVIIMCLLLFSLGRSVSSYDGVSDHGEELMDKTNFEDSIDEDNDVSPTIPKSEPIISYQTLQISNQDAVFLYEPFDDEANYKRNWILSKTTKADSSESKYDGQWTIVQTDDRIKGDNGIMMANKARHHAIAAKLKKPFKFDNKNLVVQYDVQFRNGQECGGAYMKLLAAPSGDLTKVHDKTLYSIMFGPDKCGNDHKLHFIFNHKNKKTNKIREIHWKKAASVSGLGDVITDGKWHIFRLIIRPDNSFQIDMDGKAVGKGSLFEEFNPSVNLPKEIDDPEDKKPDDWDEREKIPDPDAKKPDDWDENEPRKIPDENAQKPADWLDNEPEMIPDPSAKRPEDWSEEMDGEWEPPLINNPKCADVSGCGTWKAPLIDNPNYKGKWRAPSVSNPNYQGKWSPRKIPNPDYYEDTDPFKMMTIDAAAFELWTISDGIVFDNILVTSDVDVANLVADNTYLLKKDIGDEKTDNWFQGFVRSTNKQPYLWGVYALLIIVPIILLIGRLTKTKPNNASKKEKPQVGGDEADELNQPGPSGHSVNAKPDESETEEEVEDEEENQPGSEDAQESPQEEEEKDNRVRTRSRKPRRE